MAQNVCCPGCWTWSELGSRTTCKRCGAPLVLSDGRTVEQARGLTPLPPPVGPQTDASGWQVRDPRTSTTPASFVDSSNAYGTPPPPPPEAPRRSHRLRRVVAGVAAVAVVVVAAGGVLAYRFFQGTADSLVSMTPADTGLYINVNLDPPGGQKLAVHDLLSKFPDLGDQSRAATLDQWINKLFSGSGLTFSSDVSPWLGSEMSLQASTSALSVMIPTGRAPTSAPAATVLLASKDDAKAQAFLEKLKTLPSSASGTWTTTTYGGVAVTVESGSNGGAYAVVNHTVVIGGTGAAVDAVIDSAQGHSANLTTSRSYATVQAQLPADRLATVYVDMGALVSHIASSFGGIAGADVQFTVLKALRGAGLALVASSDGVTIDGTADFDPSQLPAEQRAAIASDPAHLNGSLAYVPATAYGLLAMSGLHSTAQSVDAVAPPGSDLARTLEQYGLTGPNGFLAHLSGDAGIEVDKTQGSGAPSGALLIGTDSSSAAQSFLTNLVNTACTQNQLCDASSVTTQVDNGVTISSLALPGVSGVEPSWAVDNGWVIIGSTSAEVRAVVEGHAAGRTVTGVSQFQAVASHVGSSNNAMFYLDVPAVLSAVRATMPAADRASFDSGPGQYLAHFTGFGMSSQEFSDHTTFTLFAGIQ